MNIDGLLTKIGNKIKKLEHNQKKMKTSYGENRDEELSKRISRIKVFYVLLWKEAKKIELEHNSEQKHKIKTDLNNLYKEFKSKFGNDEMLAIVVEHNIKKLMCKYNIENITMQNDENTKSSQIQEEINIEDTSKGKSSFFQTRKTIKNNRDSKRSEDTGEKKKLPWYATLPVIGAMAAATIYGGTALINHNSDKSDLLDSTGYTDSTEPGTSENKQTTMKKTNSITYTTSVTEISSNSSTTQTEKEVTNTSTIKKSTETQTTTTTTTQKNEDKHKDTTTEPVVFDIGDQVNVSDGLMYTATCLGEGNSNKIGNVSWRPATYYYVDRIAFCYNGKVLGLMEKGEKDVRQVLEDYSSKYNIDTSEIDTSVLLSLTQGQRRYWMGLYFCR